MSESETTSNAPADAPAGCLLRLFWIVGGNAAIYLSLATIAASRAPLPSYLDAIVWITVILMIAGRWLDITRCDGRTLANEPADLRHWRRYAVAVLSATLASWSLAHLIAGSFSS